MNNTPKFETEIFRRVYNNKHGNYYQIGPDADGLGLVSIKYIDEEGKKHNDTFPVCPTECAELIGQAMIDCARELKVKPV